MQPIHFRHNQKLGRIRETQCWRGSEWQSICLSSCP